MQKNELKTFKYLYDTMMPFKVGICASIFVDSLKCFRYRSNSIKAYQLGSKRLGKHLDIVQIVKSQIDLQILKKLYLLPH